jgi:hypothetical protein
VSGSAFATIWQLGPRITASVIGVPFTQYRPSGPGNPLATARGTIPVWLTGDPALMALKPLPRNKPEVYAALDPLLTLPGDYLVGTIPITLDDGSILTTDSGAPIDTDMPGAVIFVASQDVPMPIVVVLCNAVFTHLRPGDQTPGPGFYSGAQAGETVLATGWPGSFISTTARGMDDLKLPGDAALGTATVLLPMTMPSAIRAADVLSKASGVLDDDGNPIVDRCVVKSAELTERGWSLGVVVEVA